MKKNIVLFTIYGLIFIASCILIFAFKKPFDFVAFVAILLIFQRIKIIRALKPSGFIHGDGLKYSYEKQEKLDKFKKLMEKAEKITLFIVLPIGIIICTIVCFS